MRLVGRVEPKNDKRRMTIYLTFSRPPWQVGTAYRAAGFRGPVQADKAPTPQKVAMEMIWYLVS
jgi:hypothetical protein